MFRRSWKKDFWTHGFPSMRTILYRVLKADFQNTGWIDLAWAR
jgi:hypothetical protein